MSLVFRCSFLLAVLALLYLQMHLLPDFNGVSTIIIKPNFKTSVLYWDHDNELQKQKLFVNGSKKSVFVHVWRAICDERLNSMKTVVIFVLTRLKKPEGFEHDSTVRCFNGQNPISHFNYTPILYYMPGFFVFCPFERTQTCPRTVSIQFGDQIITNEIEVERQLSPDVRNREKKHSLITVCLPAITANMGTFEPYRYKYGRWVPKQKTIRSVDDSLKQEIIIGFVS